MEQKNKINNLTVKEDKKTMKSIKVTGTNPVYILGKRHIPGDIVEVENLEDIKSIPFKIISKIDQSKKVEKFIKQEKGGFKK